MKTESPVRSLSEVTAEWLTECLNSHPLYQGAVVKSLARKPCNYVATSGSLYRIMPVYEDHQSGRLPASFILKLPSMHTDRSSYRSYYRRERKFYYEMAVSVESLVPRCIHSAWDEEDGSFHLLLEDCQLYGYAPNWSVGPPKDELRLSVIWLAKFHAAWWGMDPDPDFAPLQDDDSRFSDDRYFDEMWSRFDGCLDRRDRDICEQIFRHWKQLVVSQAERPKTLCHGDFHPNNIFLPHGGKGYPKVIDWQFCHVGIGVSDVADLMTLYVHPHLRKSCELEIIRTYWETLIQEGVENYSLEDCVTDYVIETCKNVLMPFFQLSISNLPLSAAVQCMRNVLLSFEDLIERRNNDLHEILGSIKISWPYVS